MLIEILVILLSLVILVLLKPRKFKHDITQNVVIIMGSGGHCMEMSYYCSGFAKNFYITTFIISQDDTLTRKKIMTLMKNKTHLYNIVEIFKARKVKQSYITSIFTTLYSFFQSIYIIYRTNSSLILCNGPSICVPLVVTSYVLQKIKLISPYPIVFIESLCRVRSLSLTGKMLYYFVDIFIVQWEELREKYKKSLYIGRLL